MTNIPEGSILTPDDEVALLHERSGLTKVLDEKNALMYSAKYFFSMTSWERVELSADICALSHDIEAIDKSLETGRRVY